MTFYFAWSNQKEAFDPKHHCRHDVEILSFHLSHHEGQLPLLKMVVSSFNVSSFVSCYLSYRPDDSEHNPVVMIFKGTLYHAPLNPDTQTWTLHFRGDFDEKNLSDVHLQIKPNVTDDIIPLEADFFKECRLTSPLTQKLQRQCSVVEVDRVTQDVRLCDPFQTDIIFYPKDIFDNSIRLKILESPYTHVDITITADWIQKDGGEVDISSSLHKAFPEGRMNTLTPKYMEASFPKVGAMLSHIHNEKNEETLWKGKGSKNSGYRVVESWIRPFDPSGTGILNTYPRVSPTFWEKDCDDVVPKQIHFKRVWYQTALVVEWQYRQRRRENVTLSLKNCRIAKGIIRQKQLTLTLKNIQNHDGSSFFKSMMGRRALLFAYDYGCCFLKASTRCFELSFRIPLFQGVSLSTMQMVDITQMLYQQGIDVKRSLYAKIVSYELVQKGLYGYALVRCAFSFPCEDISEIDAPFDQSHHQNQTTHTYVEDGFCVNAMVQGHAHQEIFDRVDSHIHPQGIQDTRFFHTDYIMENIHVDNHVQQQINHLHDAEYPALGRLKQKLKKYPTTFSVQFRDLRTYPLLEEKISVSCSVKI